MSFTPQHPSNRSRLPRRFACHALGIAVLLSAPAFAAQQRAGDVKNLVLAAPDQSAIPASTRALASAIVQELLVARGKSAWSPIGAVANASGELDAQLTKALDEARSSFDALDLDTAAARYEAVLTRLDKLAPHIADKLLPSRALVMLGATHLLLGDTARAETYLSRAAGIDPALAMDPTAFSPAMQPVFARVVQAVRSAPRQALRVSSAPAGAVVYANGRFVGTTPVELDGLIAAPTLLQVAHEGFEPHVEIVAPVAGAIAARDISLARSQAFARELAASRAAVSSLDEGGLPMAAQSIALARRAERVYVLWSDGSNHRLAFSTPDGKEAGEQRSIGPVTTAASARDLARALLGMARDDAQAAAPPLTQPQSAHLPTVSDRPAIADVQGDTPHVAERGLFSRSAAKNRTLWCLYAAAVATGGAAAYFGIRALDAQAEYDRVAYENPAQYDHAATTDQVEGRTVADRGSSAAKTADILAAGSAALAVTAVLLHIMWEPGTRADPAPPATDGRGAWSHLDVTFIPRRDGASILLLSQF